MSSFKSLPAVSSSGGSLTLVSKASYSVNRGVAKLAVDVMSISSGKEWVTEPGKKYNSLSSELGDDEYERLCVTPGLSLQTINYCQRGLAQLKQASEWSKVVKLSNGGSADPSTPSQALPSQAPATENFKKLKGLINHDYLVLEIQPGDTNLPILYVSAQKSSGDKPGIHIDPIPAEKTGEMLHKGVLHYSINCHNKQIPLKSLVDVLKEGNPHYNLRNANCWDYATSIAKRLLEECANVSGNGSDEKARLEREHNALEANLTSRSIVSTIVLLKEKAPLIFKSL